MEFIFATHNNNKILEINSVLPKRIIAKSLADIGINTAIPEPFNTIEQNSFTKANYIFTTLNSNCFSEDTGLIVPALNGAPGVKSARYAGDNATSEQNIEKLLAALKGMPKRHAYFKTVITCFVNGVSEQFEGVCHGQIQTQTFGQAGFGYDPIFMPDGADITFAEMSLEEKNKYSHRKKALDKFLKYLESLELL
jgi:XTP/dITP diphosphohydrolase